MDAIRSFARHIAGTEFGDLPDAAVEAAKTFILDGFGVGLAGSRGPFVQEMISSLEDSGSDGRASLWAHPDIASSASNAAMINGYQMHNSEFDCIHEAAVVHAVTCPLAAASAVAERDGGVDGAAFLTAIAVAVDTAAGLGVAAENGLRFFRPATAGLFGGVAAIGKLKGFDEDTLTAAFGLALGQVSGTMQPHSEGSPMLGMQMGFSARNAVTAADMAGQGISSIENVLEGRFGYFNMIESEHDIGSVTATLGKVWRIAEMAHKPFPSGRATHGIVDALLQLRAEHNLSADAVARVRAEVPSLTHHLVGRPIKDDMDVNYARLCGSYVGARILLRGALDMTDFLPGELSDPANLDLGRRIEVAVDDNPDPNALSPVTVTIELKSGENLRKSVTDVYGAPGNPMSSSAHLAKFRANWEFGGAHLREENREKLIDWASALESAGDVRDGLKMLSES